MRRRLVLDISARAGILRGIGSFPLLRTARQKIQGCGRALMNVAPKIEIQTKF